MRKAERLVLTFSLLLLLSACSSASAGSAEFALTAEAAEVPVPTELPDPEPETPAETAAEPEEPREIMVHVCGAVNRAGVYTLAEGSRVCQAVEAAGGFAPDADEAWINQAEVLQDGVRLRIPTREETAEAASLADGGQTVPEVVVGGEPTRAEAPSDGKVNINTADAETLCTLNGIGASTAAKIIADREANGRFSSIEDIMRVSGIKEKVFAKIKEDITI